MEKDLKIPNKSVLDNVAVILVVYMNEAKINGCCLPGAILFSNILGQWKIKHEIKLGYFVTKTFYADHVWVEIPFKRTTKAYHLSPYCNKIESVTTKKPTNPKLEYLVETKTERNERDELISGFNRVTRSDIDPDARFENLLKNASKIIKLKWGNIIKSFNRDMMMFKLYEPDIALKGIKLLDSFENKLGGRPVYHANNF